MEVQLAVCCLLPAAVQPAGPEPQRRQA